MMSQDPPRPVPPQELCQVCDLSEAGFATTAELEPVKAGVGQSRAMAAIELGIAIDHAGYNLFLMGSTGLGKHALIGNVLEERRRALPAPDDWCYVADFADPHRPRALRLPTGRGKALREDMERLLEELLNAIPAAFQSEDYNRRAEAIQQEFKDREEEAASAIGREAKERGIALIHTPNGYSLAPVKDGHMLSAEEFANLPEEEKARIGKLIDELREGLQKTLSQVPQWQTEVRRRFKALHREIAQATTAGLVAEVKARYADLPAVLEYLAAVECDLIDNAEVFRAADEEGKTPAPGDPQFVRYRVNLLVDNAELEGAPVVYEDNPNYVNLIGRIEHIARMGTLMTDFSLIEAGALHRANGGFLVLDAVRLLGNPFAWDALKRVLRAREIRIDSLERRLSLTGSISLEPQPIPVDLKVVLVGERLLYYLLEAFDPDFGALFKVAADFAEDMHRLPENETFYARLIATLQQEKGLLPVTRAGVELVVELAARRAQDAERLSIHMGGLSDLLVEADFLARRAGTPQVGRDHMAAARKGQQYRLDQLRERLQEEILRGTLLIDTAGVQLGQVNGLSLSRLGDHAFGFPIRISATARVGGGELVDIQREVEQGGPIHAKGVLILASYLGRRYARFQPLCLSASLVFEQTYGLVEGDSASAAELCALLSAIGDIPLKQSLAITGSVNQHGEIQAIGGVNEKVEGFFDICSARGLTGEQGVVIPASNRRHLMLRDDVVAAAAAGRFHVYAVCHVDQAMELLTGQRAGRPDALGNYPEDSINGQIQARLTELFRIRQRIDAEMRGEGHG